MENPVEYELLEPGHDVTDTLSKLSSVDTYLLCFNMKKSISGIFPR